MNPRYDLLVIGAGMAGVTAAEKCAARGWSVAVVDALPYGGTCALRGCDPKKILRRAAEVVDAATAMQGKGIDTGGLTVDWADLMAHKRGFTDRVPGSIESGLAGRGVRVLHGRARFTGPSTVAVDDVPFEAGHVLVATGAGPRPLDVPGEEHVIDSTAFLDLTSLPRRILFVGGGYVSFEFAHLAARAGSEPVVVHRDERPLAAFDPDLVELLLRRGAEAGVQVRLGTAVTDIEPSASGYRVHLDAGGAPGTVDVDLVVHGAGRRPELAGLDLEAAGVASGPDGVTVADHLQSTTNPAVFAAGDAADTPGQPLTPVAVTEAKVAASNMLRGATSVPDYTGVPTAVFTLPELTRVGMLEADAWAAGIDLDVRYTDTSSWYSTYRVGGSGSVAKVLVDRSTDLVVGAHLLGPDASELVNPLALAMVLDLTTRQLRSATAAYPTLGSDLAAML